MMLLFYTNHPQVLASQSQVGAAELDLLLRFPIQPNVVSPIDFLTNNSWGAIRSLSQVDEFRSVNVEIICKI